MEISIVKSPKISHWLNLEHYLAAGTSSKEIVYQALDKK
jgi:hypothetical protein